MLSNRQTRVVLIFSLLLASGCDSKSKAGDIQNQLATLTKSVSDLVGDSTTTQEAMEEFRKLQQYEYKLQSFPANTLPIELEASLNRLGKERWECFHVEKRIGQAAPPSAADSTRPEAEPQEIARPEIVLFCKRRPETPLRFIPRGLLSAL